MLCKIGDVEVWRILEIHAPFMMPEELFPNAGPDVKAITLNLVPGSIDAASGRLILPIQGFLLKTPSHNILVDSCVGNNKTMPDDPNWHQRSDGRFMAALTAAGVSVQCWYPDWHFKYDTDAELAVKSRRGLLEQCSETRCIVLGSHFSLPSLGYVKAGKNAFRWEE